MPTYLLKLCIFAQSITQFCDYLLRNIWAIDLFKDIDLLEKLLDFLSIEDGYFCEVWYLFE